MVTKSWHAVSGSDAADLVKADIADIDLRDGVGHWPREPPKAGPVDPFSSVPTVSVVIPTLNEAANLPLVLPRIPGWVHEVVIVDGHSTDGTADVARSLREDVLVLAQTGTGKGNALACGLAVAAGDIIVMADADGSTRFEEIGAFVDALLDGAHFVKGSRFTDGGGSSDITQLRRLGNAALVWLVNRLFRTQFTDLCYGYNAVWRNHVTSINLDCDGFEVETQMNLRAAAAGLQVAEVPSFELERIHGVSNLNAWRDGKRVLATIALEYRNLRRRRRHLALLP